jgi:hypothetical protein
VEGCVDGSEKAREREEGHTLLVTQRRVASLYTHVPSSHDQGLAIDSSTV